MVPILFNKDVFEPSYNDLKFTVWNCNYICTNQRIDAFELWCWRKLLRVPWTARRSNQSILKEISPGCSLEGLMLKLKLQYFDHRMQRVDSLEKDSDAGRDWGQEEKGTTEDEMAGWHHQLDGCAFEWTPGVGDGQGGLVCCDSWGCKESDTTERLNWTELNTSWCSMARKENTRQKDWKRISLLSLSLIMEDIITYVENPRVSTNKWLELIYEFRKSLWTHS